MQVSFLVLFMGVYSYKTMGTRGIVNPDPMRAVVCEEVLAPVLVITSRATHGGGYYPLVVKR
jgi:hypothetical protein